MSLQLVIVADMRSLGQQSAIRILEPLHAWYLCVGYSEKPGGMVHFIIQLHDCVLCDTLILNENTASTFCIFFCPVLQVYLWRGKHWFRIVNEVSLLLQLSGKEYMTWHFQSSPFSPSASKKGRGHLLKSLAVLTLKSHQHSLILILSITVKCGKNSTLRLCWKFSAVYLESRRSKGRGNPIMSDPLMGMSGEAWGGPGWLLVALSLIPPKGKVSPLLQQKTL